MIPSLLLMFGWTSVSMAGDGPWTLPARSASVYLGVNQVQFETLKTAEGEVGVGGVSAFTGVGVATFGLFDGAEAEVILPWTRVNHRDPDSELCTRADKPRDFCATTEGLSNLQLRLKGRLMDEGSLQPVTLSIAGALRSSELTSAYRNRLTAIGDGQTDVGLQSAVGRTGNVASTGWYRTALTVGYWRRLALEGSGADKVPADELGGRFSAIVAPVRQFGLGPVVTGFHRLGGIEFEDIAPDDPNGFPALAGSQVKAGGELAFSGENDVTVSLGALGTVWARNNPSDTWVLSFGVGWYDKDGFRRAQ